MTSKRTALLLASAAMLAMGGCVDPQMTGDGQRGERIVEVVCFYPWNMWQSYDKEGDLNPEGFAFVMYLLSSKTGKGVHADGLVHVRLYRIERGPDRRTQRKLAREWTARTAELRRRTPGRCGQGYDAYFHWGDLDIYGEEAEIVVQYESPEGYFVQSQTKPTKIPPRRA